MAIARPGALPARPIAGATWAGKVRDAGVITRELTRLWAMVNAEEAANVVAGSPADAPIVALTRASTLNLTAFGRTRADETRVENAISRLSHLYPSRATILVASPEIPASDDQSLDVRIMLMEQPATARYAAVRFECVIVEVDAENEQHLTSIATQLQVVDLPDFLWWSANTSIGSKLFVDLAENSDRVIVDTSIAPNPGAELRHLLELPRRHGAGHYLGDFAWQRLAPWRKLVTQFFDHADALPALHALDEVQISYGVNPATGDSGLSGALLMAGWLGSCLNWHSPGEMVRSRQRTDEWRVTLRAGTPADRREVALTLIPVEDPIADRGLASVVLLADGGASGAYRIERFDDDELATVIQTPKRPTSRRMVFAEQFDEATLLAGELRHFGRDGVFEAALKFGSDLAPYGS